MNGYVNIKLNEPGKYYLILSQKLKADKLVTIDYG